MTYYDFLERKMYQFFQEQEKQEKKQKQEKKLQKLLSKFKEGDIVVTVGKCLYIAGCKAKVLKVELWEGKYPKVLVDYDYASKSKKHCVYYENVEAMELAE